MSLSDLSYLNSKLQDGWVFTHLILLEPDWQVILKNNEHVVVATGDSPSAAFVSALWKIEHEQWAGRLFHLKRMGEPLHQAGKSLLASLGLEGKPFKRRRIG